MSEVDSRELTVVTEWCIQKTEFRDTSICIALLIMNTSHTTLDISTGKENVDCCAFNLITISLFLNFHLSRWQQLRQKQLEFDDS